MNTESSKQQTTSVTRITQLEASIKSMKTRIESLLKFQNANQRQIKHTLKSSIHHIGHKIAQTEYSETLKRTKQTDKERIKLQHKQISQFRERQNEEFERIKETMKQMKRNESEIIKKQSRINDGIVKENRRKIVESKKENVEKMKQIRQETRRSLVNRWKQNHESMLQTRRKQAFECKLREESVLQNKIKELERIQRELAGKVQESNQTSQTLHQVAKDTNNISQMQFYKIIKQVKKQKKVSNENDLKNQIYERFLSSRMGETLKGRSTFKDYSNNQSTVIERSARQEKEIEENKELDFGASQILNENQEATVKKIQDVKEKTERNIIEQNSIKVQQNQSCQIIGPAQQVLQQKQVQKTEILKDLEEQTQSKNIQEQPNIQPTQQPQQTLPLQQ